MIQQLTPSDDTLSNEIIQKAVGYWEHQKIALQFGEGPKLATVGKPKAFNSPQHYWEVACDYFKLCVQTPWIKQEFKSGQGLVNIPVVRPYTIDGHYQYVNSIGIITKLEHYRTNKDGRYTEYVEVVGVVDRIIRTQKLEGALVGAFNASIVSHELGHVNKHQHEIKKQVFKIGGQEIEL